MSNEFQGVPSDSVTRQQMISIIATLRGHIDCMHQLVEEMVQDRIIDPEGLMASSILEDFREESRQALGISHLNVSDSDLVNNSFAEIPEALTERLASKDSSSCEGCGCNCESAETTAPTFPSVENLIGLTLAQAELQKPQGMFLRVTSEVNNGQHVRHVVTMDARGDRISVGLVDGKIAKAKVG